jgi:large subunit ribosomal protein L23
MNKSPYRILQKPLITEKSVDVRERNRTMCFKVDSQASKAEIKKAVQAIFKVKVASVHTARFAGKMRRRGRLEGYQADWKKAYVKLRAGEKMPEYTENA